MGIVYQHDKRSGITYAYESYAFRDKETKKSRAIRKLIGRVDPITGEIVPTDGRGRKDKVKKEKSPDYESLYEKMLKKCEAQDTLILALQSEIKKLKGLAD